MNLNKTNFWPNFNIANHDVINELDCWPADVLIMLYGCADKRWNMARSDSQVSPSTKYFLCVTKHLKARVSAIPLVLY